MCGIKRILTPQDTLDVNVSLGTSANQDAGEAKSTAFHRKSALADCGKFETLFRYP